MIKVLVVDDSALIRALLGKIIEDDPMLVLVGSAPDAFVARDMVKRFQPDVITLDIEMPKVDGLAFLERLMQARPTPVIMISTLTSAGAEATLRALELGAVDFIAKPKIEVSRGIEAYQALITGKIKMAAKARLVKPKAPPSGKVLTTSRNFTSSEKLLAIGASTGGTEAIKYLLMQFPASMPAIVITQHMPPGFTKTFATRLDSLCKVRVKEAVQGERLLAGCAYIAPGDQHMEVIRSGSDYRVRLHQEDRVSGHRPSVDVMFRSLALSAGVNTVAVIMTGMGRDGAEGMAQLSKQGCYTFAQDEASCVVFGMPKEAIKLNAVNEVLGIDQLAEAVLKKFSSISATTRL
ncbi:chemotaxis response regulator protein-glutamate methylesterase [Reinekea sp.]|jgi:two-component system chemotaxis response regulator CheB|uniref:protein-glutamate methylesterase/protein-glutamine glutaminase n=1 Tax=Reinekea sp. TaxID=1970455 RepID=UPI002A82B04C|nr:chemotaxis response regulator protein-glutamate methylesterase [Reinekea sp.]